MPRAVRAEQNMRFFRKLNVGIDGVQRRWLSGGHIGFVCECAELGCRATVYLTSKEFHAARGTSGHFITRPDHVDSATERVVIATDRYVIVAPAESAVPTGPAREQEPGMTQAAP
jgi:hypothetical protein